MDQFKQLAFANRFCKSFSSSTDKILEAKCSNLVLTSYVMIHNVHECKQLIHKALNSSEQWEERPIDRQVFCAVYRDIFCGAQ